MKLLILGIVAIIIVTFTYLTVVRSGTAPIFSASQSKIESTQAEPIRTAKKIYQDKKNQKVDMEKSPCLSDDMGDGYALDIAHNPRISLDDQVQCDSIKSGKLTHFVEMTPDGKILRIQ